MPGGSKYGGSGSKATPNTALAAVAFQDQLLRNLSLGNPIPSANRKKLTNKTPSWNKNVRPTIDTGLSRKPATKKTDEEKEYVLDPKPPPPTLAQKLGLVEAPVQLLTENDWQVVKDTSNRRQDSSQPCVICKDDFGTEQQLLLSCSHVFHRACLEAFERFTGKKTCPLCRKEQYQKRVIHEGARHHRQVAATRIQATWRGYVVRKWYAHLRETVPPKDPGLRKKFYENKLKTITDRMVNSYDMDINTFLQDIDRSLENSRQVFQHFDHTLQTITEEEWAAIQLKAVERGAVDCPICLNALDSGAVTERAGGATNKPPLGGPTAAKAHQHHHRGSAPKGKTKSGGPQRTAGSMGVGRAGAGDEGATLGAASDSGTSRAGKTRRTMLLSCSHVFHQTCFEALEEFAVGERHFVCPVCRSSYQKRLM